MSAIEHADVFVGFDAKTTCREGAGFCSAMSGALNAGPGEGKGLARILGWLPSDSKGTPARELGVVYRDRPRCEGFVLNVCPWCRADIRFWLSEEERKAK